MRSPEQLINLTAEREDQPKEIEVKIVNLGDPEDFLSRLQELGGVLVKEKRLLRDSSYKKNNENEVGKFTLNLSVTAESDKLISCLKLLGLKITNQDDNNNQLLIEAEGQLPSRTVRFRQDGGVNFFNIKEKRVKGREIDSRAESEVALSSDSELIKLLERLGYVNDALREKYRTSYEFGGGLVELNQGPVGPAWAEIEAADEETVKKIAEQLGYQPADLKAIGDVDYYVLKTGLDSKDVLNLSFEKSK